MKTILDILSSKVKKYDWFVGIERYNKNLCKSFKSLSNKNTVIAIGSRSCREDCEYFIKEKRASVIVCNRVEQDDK